MFFSKLCRLFRQKSKSKKAQFNELLLQNEPPKFADDKNPIYSIKEQTPPQFSKFPRYDQAKYGPLKNVYDDDDNESTVTTTTTTTSTMTTTKPPPKFRKSAKWQSSKPFAQNAYRFRFRVQNSRPITPHSSKSSASYKRIPKKRVNLEQSIIFASYHRAALKSNR